MKGIYRKLNAFFWTMFAKKTLGNFHAKIRANGFTVLSKNTQVGINVHFNGLKVLGKGKVFIGNNFHSGFGCLILTGIHDYNGEKIPYDHKVIYKDVNIADNVWLGINVTILPGVTIGEGAIIQAGSVVVNDIPAYSIAGGHPAKVFLKRDIEHYNKLKVAKSFL